MNIDDVRKMLRSGELYDDWDVRIEELPGSEELPSGYNPREIAVDYLMKLITMHSPAKMKRIWMAKLEGVCIGAAESERQAAQQAERRVVAIVKALFGQKS